MKRLPNLLNFVRALLLSFCILSTYSCAHGQSREISADELALRGKSCLEAGQFVCAMHAYAKATTVADDPTSDKVGVWRFELLKSVASYSIYNFEDPDALLYKGYVANGLEIARIFYPSGSLFEGMMLVSLHQRLVDIESCEEISHLTERLSVIVQNIDGWKDVGGDQNPDVRSFKEIIIDYEKSAVGCDG